MQVEAVTLLARLEPGKSVRHQFPRLLWVTDRQFMGDHNTPVPYEGAIGVQMIVVVPEEMWTPATSVA